MQVNKLTNKASIERAAHFALSAAVVVIHCFGAVFVVLFARDARGLACSGLLLAGIRSRLVDDPAAHNREQILRVQDFGFRHFHDVS